MADGFQASPDMASVAVTRRQFSVAELDAMFDAQILSRDEKIELIDGDIIQVNSQMMLHGVLKMRVLKKLMMQLPDHLEVSSELTVQLSSRSLVDPDVLITPKLSPQRRYVQANELYLAIEVADSSLAHDLGTKAALYATSGIPELWVIDVIGTQTWVHRAPSASGYTSIISVSFTEALVPLVDESTKVIVSELLA